jgi:cell division protein FtsI/penicillin-binding protein 2
MSRSVPGPDQLGSDEPTPYEAQTGDSAVRQSASGDNPSAIRALLLFVAFLAVSIVVVARLVAWQVPGNAANDTSPVVQADEHARGRIVDSNGVLLAVDSFSWEVYARPGGLQNSPDSSLLIAGLAEILGRSEETLRSDLSDAPELLIVDKAATESQCHAIEELNHPDLVWCHVRRQRVYPMNALGAFLIGFANMDQAGAAGTEWSYDAWLTGSPKWPSSRLPGSPVEPLPESWKLYLPSPSGRDLVLHMNAALQYMTEKRLSEAVEYYGAESGTVIILNPRTGGILALANVPSFDPNFYAEAPEDLWGMRSYETVEPGSAFS